MLAFSWCVSSQWVSRDRLDVWRKWVREDDSVDRFSAIMSSPVTLAADVCVHNNVRKRFSHRHFSLFRGRCVSFSNIPPCVYWCRLGVSCWMEGGSELKRQLKCAIFWSPTPGFCSCCLCVCVCVIFFYFLWSGFHAASFFDMPFFPFFFFFFFTFTVLFSVYQTKIMI